jgi:hypothetical protein
MAKYKNPNQSIAPVRNDGFLIQQTQKNQHKSPK